MAWADVVERRDVQARYYLLIQGIPDVFLDGVTPSNAGGTLWPAPTSKGFVYTYRENTLDVTRGIQVAGTTVIRATAQTSPGSLTLHLRDDANNYLRTLFAKDRAGGVFTFLIADLPYDTAHVGTHVTVEDTAAWPATGHAYLGRETMFYGVKAATDLDCRVAVGGDRDLYSLFDGAQSYGDLTYAFNANQILAPRWITSWPTTWHGRYVRLFQTLVDVHGRSFDSAIGGVHSREIWRGILKTVTPAEEWTTWRLETRSIEAILETDVGREPIEASLVQVPGSAASNANGTAEGTYGYAPSKDVMLHVVDANTNQFKWGVSEWVTIAAKQAGTAATLVKEYTETLTLGLFTSAGLRNALNAKVKLRTDADFPDLNVDFETFNGVWARIDVEAQNGKAFTVTFEWSVDNSVAPLIGMEGTTQVTVYTGGQVQLITLGAPLGAYLSPTSTTIPFWYAPTLGVEAVVPPASGWAKIGDQEIVHYATIATTTIAGIWQMTGVQRGRLGTIPVEHKVVLNPDWTAEQDQMRIAFGLAFDEVSFLTVILQLAVSTGLGHHGVYDVLTAGQTPGLDPMHFDLGAIEAVRDGMVPSMHRIRMFLSKPKKLAELITDWLAPLGLYWTARTNGAGEYRITVGDVMPPLESEVIRSLGVADLDAFEPAEWQTGSDLVLNAVKIDYRWDILKEKNLDGWTLSLIDRDSAYDHGTTRTKEIRLRGYAWTPAQAHDYGIDMAVRTFARFGRPYDLLRLRTGRVGWLLRVGDVVAVTVPGLPGPDGGVLTSRRAVVAEIDHDYWAPSGAIGSDVVLIVERYWRQSTYVPSGRVTAYAPGVPSVTLAANAYTKAGVTTDAAHFVVGDYVWLFDEGDWAARDERQIMGIAGHVLTLNAALVLCGGGSDAVVTGADYSSAVTAQRAHVHVASDATPPVLTQADTSAFRYA